MKIVHLADLHLGYRAFHRLSEEGLNIREKDVIRAFKEALDKIIQIKPDLIVMAGDIFHKPRPSNSSIYITIKLLQQFRQHCDAPIIMISGNHEAVKSTEIGSVLTLFESVIPKVKVIVDNIQEVPIESLNTSVLCIPHGGLGNIEKTEIKPNKDYKYNIIVIHGTYENCPEISGYGNGSPIKKTDLNEAQWNYIAFGHYHKFTELAPNAYYSGAIELTTSNIWQESTDKKGFIEFDMDEKICKFHSLQSPRKVVDIRKIDAKDMTAADINFKIIEEVSKIKDFDKSIVRISFINVDSIAIRELDYKKIRELKRTAVHFRLNLIKKDNIETSESNDTVKKKDLNDYLEEELLHFELSNGIDKELFTSLAKKYFYEMPETLV